ncbi:MAG: hypothetical protein KIT22_06615 [Verrucomicrobiae bacterium]|nr:hypothetical protein [Verrucomicrobiae bacterium]
MKRSRLLLLSAALAGFTLTQAADEKAAKPKLKPYPLDFCLISDEKFEGSGMTPFETTVDDQTIKLCCKSCLKDFNKDTKKYLKKLDEEVKKQAKAKK